MRLPAGYNMHHLYRYETMSWEMFYVHRFKDLEPPFVSVTYPIAPALKVRGLLCSRTRHAKRPDMLQ